MFTDKAHSTDNPVYLQK